MSGCERWPSPSLNSNQVPTAGQVRKDAAAPPCHCQETHLPAATCLWLPPRARGPQRACTEKGAGRQPGCLVWSVRQNTSAAGTRRRRRPQQPDTAGTAAACRKDMALKDFSLVFPRSVLCPGRAAVVVVGWCCFGVQRHHVSNIQTHVLQFCHRYKEA